MLRAIAKFFSNAGAPPITLFFSAALVGASIATPEAFTLGLTTGLISGIVPLIILALMRSKNQITSLDLNTARDRAIGFGLALLLGVVAYVTVLFLSSPDSLLAKFFVAHLLATGIMFALTSITVKSGWKASVHSGGAACLAFLAILLGCKYSTVWGPLLVILISWSRLYLNQHSISQVIVGIAIGLSVYSAILL